jgi:anti-sigma factor RsiW
MNPADPLKLSALLDGELPPAEARELSVAVQRDPAAAALLAELQTTRQVLRSADLPATLPASREFYWSKIERDIRRLSPPSPARSEPGLWAKLRLLILPTAALAALVVVVMAGHLNPSPAAPKKAADTDAPTVETALASTDATTYRDTREGTTLVWFTNKKPAAPVPGTNGVN